MNLRRGAIRASLLSLTLLSTPLLHADDVKWTDKVSMSGYVEGFYLLDLNSPSSYSSGVINSGIGGTVPFRAFDIMPNQFDYSAETMFSYADEASKSKAMVDLLVGNKANIVMGAANFANTNNSDPSLYVAQAYLSQGFGDLTLTIGKFGTPVGYEVWNSTANANFSRSLVYTQEPFYQLGLKLDYAMGSTTATLWADNGNSLDQAVDNGKNVGAALNNTSIKNLGLILTWYEDHLAIDTPVHVFDFIATYKVSDALSFAGEYLYKTIIYPNPTNDPLILDPKVQGYAVYASYAMGDFTVSPRFEQLFNPDFGDPTSSSAGSSLQYNDVTLTLKYAKGPVSHMLEYRADSGANYEFMTSDTSNPVSQVNQTLTYAAVYGY